MPFPPGLGILLEGGRADLYFKRTAPNSFSVFALLGSKGSAGVYQRSFLEMLLKKEKPKFTTPDL